MRNWTLAKVEVTGSLFAFLFIVFSPGTLAVTSEKIFLTGDINTEIHEPQAVVNRAASLLGWRGIPEHFTRENPVRTGKEFDINKIFTPSNTSQLGKVTPSTMSIASTLSTELRFFMRERKVSLATAPFLSTRKRCEPGMKPSAEVISIEYGPTALRKTFLNLWC